MTRDRLHELRQLAAGADSEILPIDLPQAPQHVKDIEHIFQEAERTRAWIREIDDNTRVMRALHSDPTFHANKQLQDQMDSLVTQSNATGAKVCGALRQLEERARADALRHDAQARIARLQYASARRLYADALQRHHALLQIVRDYQMDLLHQQIKLTNLTISDEECESLLESRNMSLFVGNIKAETAAARLSLREAEARRDELARIEAALRDVRDLFAQLAHLVATQQEQIDTVEYYALQATEHVETGGQELLKGTVSKNKAVKKKISLVICLATGLAIVILVLVAT